jgi:D-sedoheptulose 7-phosphate isomerase
MGNGGSAATASHVTTDLVKGCRVGGAPGFRAFCLSDSNALVTCLANDFSYEEIYSVLLRTYAKTGDVAVAFSGSGNSPNIVHGLATARDMGLTTIGFGGRDAEDKALCDLLLTRPTDSLELLEDLHSSISITRVRDASWRGDVGRGGKPDDQGPPLIRHLHLTSDVQRYEGRHGTKVLAESGEVAFCLEGRDRGRR